MSHTAPDTCGWDLEEKLWFLLAKSRLRKWNTNIDSKGVNMAHSDQHVKVMGFSQKALFSLC